MTQPSSSASSPHHHHNNTTKSLAENPILATHLATLRRSIRDGDLISILQYLKDMQYKSSSASAASSTLPTHHVQQLMILAIYSYRLKILSFLLGQFPHAVMPRASIKKSSQQHSYGHPIEIALQYDKRALYSILQFKYGYVDDSDALDWNILHRWVVGKWLVHYEKDLKVAPESDEAMPQQSENSAIIDSVAPSATVLTEVQVPQPTEQDFNSLQLLTQQDQQGWTPLHLAAMLGDLEACEKLVACNQQASNAEAESQNNAKASSDSALNAADYEEGRQPLHIAAAFGYPKIVEYLMFSGADVEMRDKRGESLLLVAVKHGQEEVVKFLLNEFVSNLQTDTDLNGNFPMLLAIKHSHPAIVKLLLEAGVDPNREINDEMMTYLHYLCSLQYCKKSEKLIAKLLISYGGANVDAKDRHGATPLHYALLYTREEMAELLLKHNAVFTEPTIDLIRTNMAAQKLYMSLRKKKLTEHAAALVYPLNTLKSCKVGLSGHTSSYYGFGQMMVFGGVIEKRSKSKRTPPKYSNKLRIFESSFAEDDSGTWIDIPNSSNIEKRAYHSCVTLNQKLWFYGGENASGRLPLFQCFDIATREWLDYTPQYFMRNDRDSNEELSDEDLAELSGYPGPLSKHTATLSFRKQYTIEELYEQDVDTIRNRVAAFKETRDPLMVQACADAPNAVPDSQCMYIYGGLDEDGEVTDSLWEYNFATGYWTQRPTGPPARRGHTCIYDHNRNSLLIFGGYDGDNFLNDLYDVSLWDYEVTMIGGLVESESANPKDAQTPPPRTGHSACLSSNRMWIFGGYNGVRLNDLWYLSLDTGRWSQVDISATRFVPRYNFTVNFINEKQIAVFGGKSIYKNNMLLVHLPEHHKLHERIFSSAEMEEYAGEEGEEYVDSDEYAGETSDEEHLHSESHLIEARDYDQSVVRDAPTTEYY